VTWDIFCTVIDNFGDIGVTWRLARQLADEHRLPVRLWVDDLAAFQRIRPEIDPQRATQTLAGVEIRHWTSPLPDIAPGEVVIEALACDLPDEFVARMAARQPKPVWLNLEYLTAEDWAMGVHGLPSPHPRLPLTKYFFMPGYGPGSGGLTREAWLPERRDAFQANPDARAAFWGKLGLPGHTAGELRLSLFSYENAALPGLLDAWASSKMPVRALVPAGKSLPEIAIWFGLTAVPEPSAQLEQGMLTLHVLPMLELDDYDRLLWACDLNFVRGEDSFVRAQFAKRPMVWQAYRQEDGAHFAKLEAFLDLYCDGMEPELAAITRDAWRAWNRESDFTPHWPALRKTLPGLGRHAEMWCDHLAEQSDLASNLLIFCKKKLE
jgi:uncharacterized repeat protein (TIGR03837 family)